MAMILSNEEIEQILTMEELVPVLEDAYIELAEGRGSNRLRSDIVTPTTFREDGLYALKSMDCVIPKFGVGAIRINSDILTFPKTDGQMRRVKAPAAPGERYTGMGAAVQHPYRRAADDLPRRVAHAGRRHQRARGQAHGAQGRTRGHHPRLRLAGGRAASRA